LIIETNLSKNCPPLHLLFFYHNQVYILLYCRYT